MKYNYHIKSWIAGYLFLLPVLIFFVAFVAVPMLRGINVSFYNYSLNTFDYVGFGNYKTLFNDDVFKTSLINTILIVVGSVPLVIIFSLFVSLNIYRKSAWLRSFFRGIFYLPAISSIVSITIVWGWIYHPQYGILNYLLGLGGVKPISWLGDPKYALMAIVFVLITTSVGQPIILYVASLGNIPSSYFEAAEIDGASSWQMFKHITWPLLMPTSLYIIIITTINSFQCFSLIQLLTSGGPSYHTSTLMYLIYEKAFTLNQYGLSSAIGVILAIIIIIISIIQYRYLGSDVEY
ncbi:MAG: carbohydrate ABC transporter permease [Bacillaceae bacterium]